MNNYQTIFILALLLFCQQINAQIKSEIQTKPFSIGETLTFKSEVLNEVRDINIYLPHGYDPDSIKKYPVIYLLDGSVDEDFIHIVGLVQFGSFSWINMIPESIIVGIANVDRKRDFTFPTNNEKDKKDFPTTGGSELFIKFIQSELQPLIDKNYKTTAVKTIIGQSLGGLVATEILFKYSNLFDNYVIISPSLWWDDESLLKYKPILYSSDKSIYIGVGKEGPIMEKSARELSLKLNENKKDNTRLFFQYFEELDHGDTLHLAVYDCFKKMFEKPLD